MQQLTRTRIAPTPSGYLHLGNVYSFAITVAMARRVGARVLLRIDDLDFNRVKPAYVEDIFDTLTYLGLPWDEGPRDYSEYERVYSQRHRMPLYEEVLQQLLRQGHVFACDCTRSTLLARHPRGVYTGTCRQRGLLLDASGHNWRVDTLGTALPPSMQYFVVRKRDGFPAYQLASLVDDMHYGIDLIVRGADLRESTQAQAHLAHLLGYDAFLHASFHHHNLLMAGGDEKLSKSAGATSIQYLRKQGKTPKDIYRMIGRQAGLPDEVSSWRELGDIYQKKVGLEHGIFR